MNAPLLRFVKPLLPAIRRGQDASDHIAYEHHAATGLCWLSTAAILRQPSILRNVICPLTTIRDNFLPVEWRAKLQILDYLPTWPWRDWVIGLLLLTLIIFFVGACRWISKVDRALNDRELPGRNANEIARWQEKGRTPTNEWRHLLQHGAASPYQRAEQEADEWRRDMRQRLERKYGEWVATNFNETHESDSEGMPLLSHLAEHDARAERLARIMYDVGTDRIRPRSQEPF